MTTPATNDDEQAAAIPPVVDHETWEAALADLRAREKAATRELDAIAAARRRLPMVELPDYTLEGPDGPVRLVDIFEGKRQLIVYSHMWFPGEKWQCGGCTGFTSQFTRLEFLAPYDARFVIVTQGPIDEALAYKARVGNRMDWYSTANSPFGSDMGAPPGGGFQVIVFLRVGENVMVRKGNREAIVGTGAIALAFTGVLYLVTDLVFTTQAAIAVALVFFALTRGAGGRSRSTARPASGQRPSRAYPPRLTRTALDVDTPAGFCLPPLGRAQPP